MANQRDINRWKKGKDHWNKWAEGRLKAKEKLEKEGKWRTNKNAEGLNRETIRWLKDSSVDFTDHSFVKVANFEDFIFPHNASLSRARFTKYANFSRAQFLGKTWFIATYFNLGANFSQITARDEVSFRAATFASSTTFNKAEFLKKLWFRGARFEDDVDLARTKFFGTAGFGQVSFARRTDWKNAEFHSEAIFRSANIQGPFYLNTVKFAHVPDFTQINLEIPIRLDNMTLPPAKPFSFSGDRERAARYRALKRIASESHDHVQEKNFFTSEAKERRGSEDDPMFGTRWFLSLIYELFSDFGRSTSRPFGWLLVSLLSFAAITGSKVKPEWLNGEACNWQSNWLLPEIYLSFLHSLPIVGFGRGEKRDQALACLFGDKANVGPGWDMLFIGQNIWSAILIFLFLLAIRNHFRIK